jgi:hypothetical protein
VLVKDGFFFFIAFTGIGMQMAEEQFKQREKNTDSIAVFETVFGIGT